ncbi:MAG: hypothetical protein ACLT38_06975 [Akkermansia sp.]
MGTQYVGTVPGMSNEELAQLTGVETVVTEAGFTGRNVFCRPTLEINGIGGGYQGEEARRLSPAMPLPNFMPPGAGTAA